MVKLIQINRGQSESDLTDFGRSQADAVGNKLKSIRFDFVFSSDLRRASQTTSRIVSAATSPKEVILDHRLREFSLGQREGWPVGTTLDYALQNPDHKPKNDPLVIEIRSGNILSETKADVINRGIQFLKDLQKNVIKLKSSSNILLVSHGGFISTFLSSVLGVKNLKSVQNCSVNKVELKFFPNKAGKLKFELANFIQSAAKE